MNNKTEIDFLNYDDLNLVEEKIKECTDRANEAMSPQINKIIDGKSTQETTTGKNLLDTKTLLVQSRTVNGLNYLNNGNGTFNISGTTTINTSLELIQISKDFFDFSKTYYFYCSQNYNVAKFNLCFQIRKNDGSRTIFFIANKSLDFSTIDKSKVKTIGLVFYAKANTTIDSGNNVKLMIVEGDTPPSYEPYTGGQPSPSPDYPSEIENVKGKNLINPNLPVGSETKDGITLTNNSNGTYTVKGTATKTTGIDLTTQNVIKLTGNTYYTNSIEILNGTMDGAITVSVKGKDGATIYNYINLSPSNHTNTIKAKEDLTVVRYNYYIAEGTTVDFTFRVQLEKGSVATRYVPYGNIQIVETGKNLFNTIFVQGARLNTNGKDTFYSNNYIRTQNEIEVEPNTTYNIKSVSSKALSGGDIHYYDKNGNFIKREAIGINTAKTTPDDCYYINFQYYLNTGLTPSDVYNTQVEKGSATPYEPYTEEVVNIDLKGNELCSLPNGTKDELIVKDGRAKIIKRIRKRIFNGTESWTLQSINRHDIANFQINLNDYVGVPNILAICDTFSPQISSILNTTNEGFHLNAIKDLFIRIKKSKCSTVDEFKTWLSTHNVTIQYELKEPYEIDLGPLEVYFTYETKKWVINELPYIQEIDRIEKGIYNLGEKYNRPKGWLTTKEWITKDNLYPIKGFDYRDWNRWVNNLNLFTTDIVVKDTIWNGASFINWEQIGKDEGR